jgi:hypothetical protein
VLDMQFLTQVSLYYKFLSRTTHQLIGDVIARANTAFSATGADPQRMLPEIDWFVATAKKNLHRLI